MGEYINKFFLCTSFLDKEHLATGKEDPSHVQIDFVCILQKYFDM
jgi:hypothetical protein